ncbi:MAG: hypothetical protein NVSMB19_15930 [Vulcanimicrobiaceae bacterium]
MPSPSTLQAYAALVAGIAGVAIALAMYVATRTLNLELLVASHALLAYHAAARVAAESEKRDDLRTLGKTDPGDALRP